jgi:hypothetical protein
VLHLQMLYSFTFILIVVCALFFYRVGEFEGASGVVWTGLSIPISAAVCRWLRGGFIAARSGSSLPITLYRSRKKP